MCRIAMRGLLHMNKDKDKDGHLPFDNILSQENERPDTPITFGWGGSE